MSLQSFLTIFILLLRPHHAPVRTRKKLALSVRCPTCGAKSGEKCELASGQPQTNPHRDRRIVAKDEETQCSKN